jgi:hypothetical protein
MFFPPLGLRRIECAVSKPLECFQIGSDLFVRGREVNSRSSDAMGRRLNLHSDILAQVEAGYLNARDRLSGGWDLAHRTFTPFS